MKPEDPACELDVKTHSILDNVCFCIRNTAACYPPLLLWCLLAALTNVVAPVLSTFLPKAVIEKITSGSGMGELIAATLGFALSLALIMGLRRLFEKLIYHHKFKMNAFYLRKVAQKGLTTDYCNQEDARFRKLQNESFQACNGHFSALTQIYDAGVSLLSNVLGFTVYFYLLAELSPLVVLFLIATTYASYLWHKRLIRWTKTHNEEKIAYNQRMHYISGVSGDIRSAKDIRLYRMAPWLKRVYNENLKGLAGWYKRYAANVLGVTAFGSGLSLVREGASYAYLLALVLNAKIDVADFVLYFGVITGFSIWLDGILGQVNALSRIGLAFNYLRTYLAFPERYRRDGGLQTDGMRTKPGTIELRHVSYRYTGAQEDTLKDICLTISPAEHLAVVGLNGAGKTTLVKLICGLTDPTEGAVLYDGVDVRAYDRQSYYALFSAVFQQFSILPVTIDEIVAETEREKIDHGKVEQCLRRAGLGDKVDSLPRGAQSSVGKTIHDEGVELTGGEIQKLLLARALYKTAPLTILDEPTAALDPIAENRLYETYDEMMRGRSTVFISHRLASTRFCDRIVLVSGGAIAEEGTHESLLAQRGEYFHLYETQAQYYREQRGAEEGAQCT